MHAMDVLKDLAFQPFAQISETRSARVGLRDAKKISKLSNKSWNPEPGGVCAPWRCPATSSPANGAGCRGRLCRPSFWILILDFTARDVFCGFGGWSDSRRGSEGMQGDLFGLQTRGGPGVVFGIWAAESQCSPRYCGYVLKNGQTLSKDDKL